VQELPIAVPALPKQPFSSRRYLVRMFWYGTHMRGTARGFLLYGLTGSISIGRFGLDDQARSRAAKLETRSSAAVPAPRSPKPAASRLAACPANCRQRGAVSVKDKHGVAGAHILDTAKARVG
jgi:hypothetical protein